MVSCHSAVNFIEQNVIEILGEVSRLFKRFIARLIPIVNVLVDKGLELHLARCCLIVSHPLEVSLINEFASTLLQH